METRCLAGKICVDCNHAILVRGHDHGNVRIRWTVSGSRERRALSGDGAAINASWPCVRDRVWHAQPIYCAAFESSSMGRPDESDRRGVLSFRNGPFTRDDGGVCFRRRPALVTRNRAGDDAHRPGVLCIEVAVASSLMPSRSGHVGTFHFAFIHAAVVAQRIARLWEFRRLADPTTTSVARGLSRSRRTHVDVWIMLAWMGIYNAHWWFTVG